MDEKMLGNFAKELLEKGGWLVLPEFGVLSYEGVKQVDLTAFKWKNNKEVQAVAIECKCKETARESFLSALGQAVEYQLFFPEVFITTQDGEIFSDQESVLKKLGLGYIMINDKGILQRGFEPSPSENSSFDESSFIYQVRNRAIILLVFNELFPEAYKKNYFGGTKQRDLWIYNKPKGKVQFRAWAGIGSASYFGINIEAVRLIRNIVPNIDVDRLLEIFSRLPLEYNVELYERATRKDKYGYRILDRQKGSIAIKGSIFGERGFPACNLTKEQIRKEIVERSKELDYYSHLLIDKKLWDLNSNFTRDQYLKEMTNVKGTLDELYNTLTIWSG